MKRLIERLTYGGAVCAVALALLFTALPAYATTAIGTQNPDLTVSISFEPTCVKVGDTIVREFRVTNNASKRQSVTLDLRATLNGQLYSIYPYYPREHWRVQLGPGETWQDGPTTFVIYDLASQPKGTYAITLSATNKKGTSFATAQFEIYETTCSLGP